MISELDAVAVKPPGTFQPVDEEHFDDDRGRGLPLKMQRDPNSPKAPAESKGCLLGTW
jgi:hypothetical protein